MKLELKLGDEVLHSLIVNGKVIVVTRWGAVFAFNTLNTGSVEELKIIEADSPVKEGS